ncbi:hypothetical protein SJAV_25490 [Sulfurisphaera javensis]|uniref:Uncharacterized protein n=1 Tax=Sulfurisphaera javensis TaxID=2049879 RepID=A0AAT9GUV8_9CREN
MDMYTLFFFIPLVWFTTMFMIEAGSVVMIPLCRYENYRQEMLSVTGAMWAIIATSLVYLVVSLDTIYAPIMVATGQALYGLLLSLIILLALHHFLIGTAEGAGSLGEHDREKLYLTIAVPIVLLVALFGVTLFTSVFSGYGIGLSIPLTTLATVLEKNELTAVLHQNPWIGVFYPNYVQMFFNPFNWVFFIGVVFYVVYFTVAFYGIRERFLVGALALTLAHALFLASTYVWLPTVFNSAIGNAGFWLFFILTYVWLYLATFKNIPFRQMWTVLLTFTGGMMFGAFTGGYILVDTTGPTLKALGLPGVPAVLLETNPVTLAAGAVVLGMAGILVMGGVTAVSYKILYKRAVSAQKQKVVAK